MRDRGVEDIVREKTVDELHMGEKPLIIHACVAKGLLPIYFFSKSTQPYNRVGCIN